MIRKFLYGEDNSPGIENLLNHGVDEEVVIKLQDANIQTCLSLIALNHRDFAGITGVAGEEQVNAVYSVGVRLLNESGALGERLGDPDVIPKEKGTGGEVLDDEDIFVVSVKNLPGDFTIEQVRDHFKGAGDPTRIDVMEDFKNKTRSAYIYYESRMSAYSALMYNLSDELDLIVGLARSDKSSSISSGLARPDKSSNSGQSGSSTGPFAG